MALTLLEIVRGMRVLSLIGVALVTLVGCGGTAVTPPPQPGTMSVHWTPVAPTTITDVTGSLLLEEVWVLGDGPIDKRLQMRNITVDLVQPTDLLYSDLPQGLYSRYRSEIRGVTLDGTYQGTPVSIHAMFDDLFVDLRGDPVEMSLGHSGRFNVSFDLEAWVEPGELDACELTNGTILLDPTHNRTTLLTILERVPNSFSMVTEELVPTAP